MKAAQGGRPLVFNRRTLKTAHTLVGEVRQTNAQSSGSAIFSPRLAPGHFHPPAPRTAVNWYFTGILHHGRMSPTCTMNTLSTIRWAWLLSLNLSAAEPLPGANPADHLPPHIQRITWFGERADWSHDGQRLLFLSKTFGDALEIDLTTRGVRNLTAHYPHHGYTRALYLANGDILLSGPEAFDPKRPGEARTQCFLYVLDKNLSRPAQPLGTKCSEGPAVSRKRMHLAWTHVAAEYPQEMPPGSSRMQEADLVYENGQPRLVHQRLIIGSRDLPFACTLETQNFRPPQETELTFSAYGYQGTEVCGIDLASGKITNYSQAPGQYDEPEGIFPDGQFTLVECDRQNHLGAGHIDLWKLKLDGSGQSERLTYFSDYPGFKASNPVVRDDGQQIAFQLAMSRDAAGVGYGIFVLDLAKREPAAAQSPARSAAAGPAALLNEQRMLMVNGRPRFILGLYEHPQEEAVLKEAVAAGFNLFQCAPETSALDRIHRLGALAWVNLGGALDLSEEAASRRQRLTETVQRLGNHPALLVWEGPDEILWNNWWVNMEQIRPELDAMRAVAEGKPGWETLSRQARDFFERGLYADFEKARAEFWLKSGQPSPHAGIRIDDAPARVRQRASGITAGIQLVRELDARHVIWLNHAPRNSLADLRLYNQEADMAGCDIYPAPANLAVGHSDLPDLGLTAVGAYTERMRQAAPGKACAMVLQGFGWRDLRKQISEHETAVGIGRRPTWAESRFMAYEAIIHGANAILYWGTAYLKPVEDDGSPTKGRPRLWSGLLRVVQELRALEPALVAPPLPPPSVRQAETCGSIDGHGILCSLRSVGDDFVLLVVNETGDGLRFSLANLPAKLAGRTLHRLYSPEEHRLSGREFSDGIRPREVHVYATSRRFEDPALKSQ